MLGKRKLLYNLFDNCNLLKNKDDMFVEQLVRQIKDALVVSAGSDPTMLFPTFLGMIPCEIIEGCKDVKEALFYVEKTIQNNWSRAMLSYAIAAGFYKDIYKDNRKPLDNFALSRPKPQEDLADEMMKHLAKMTVRK